MRLAYLEIERLRRKLIVESVEIPDLNKSNRFYGRVEIAHFDALNLNKASEIQSKEKQFATPRQTSNSPEAPNHFDESSMITLDLDEDSPNKYPKRKTIGQRNMSQQPRQ